MYSLETIFSLNFYQFQDLVEERELEFNKKQNKRNNLSYMYIT